MITITIMIIVINYDNDNGAQTILILWAIFFGEPLVCEKAEFCECVQMLMRLHC